MIIWDDGSSDYSLEIARSYAKQDTRIRVFASEHLGQSREDPSGGAITLNGRDVTRLPAHKRRFGMVFQNFALFPHLNVRDNVAYSLTIAGVNRGEAAPRADALLDLVRLGGYGDRRIGELSGGQRQRVAIARALAQEPEVFLLDEPMSALDAKLREDMQVELRLLQQRLAITTIVVTHDQREAMTMADSIVVMSNGRVEQVGSPQDIYHRPKNAFVADFIGKANFFDGVVVDGDVKVGETTIPLTAPAEFISGSAVRIACRPEAPHLNAPAEAPGARISGQITFIRDVGPAREVYLDTAIGPMIIETAAADPVSAGVKLGDTADVTLPPASIHVFAVSQPVAA
ncbi:MAG: ATP-binding cassette domain-containing protein [Pseudomonadota bacterium]